MVCAFYACLLIGAIPVPIRPPRLDQNAPPGPPGNMTIGTSSSSLLSGPPGSGSSTALSLLGLSTGSQSTSGSTGSCSNVHIRPAAPSFEASLELIWNVVKHSNASAIFTQQSLIKLLKSKVTVLRWNECLFCTAVIVIGSHSMYGYPGTNELTSCLLWRLLFIRPCQYHCNSYPCAIL